jgi:hypothetical protein
VAGVEAEAGAGAAAPAEQAEAGVQAAARRPGEPALQAREEVVAA